MNNGMPSLAFDTAGPKAVSRELKATKSSAMLSSKLFARSQTAKPQPPSSEPSSSKSCDVAPILEESVQNMANSERPPVQVGAFQDEIELKTSAEYFGFNPPSLIDDVYNAAASYIKNALDEMENTLLTDPETKRHSRAIVAAVARVQDRLVESLEKNVDKFELWASRNIFCIPDGLDLEGCPSVTNYGECTVFSAEQEISLDEDMAALRKRIYCAELMNKAIKHKIVTLQEHRESVQKAAGIFLQAAKRIESHGITDLKSVLAEIHMYEAEMSRLEISHHSIESENLDDALPTKALALSAAEPAEVFYLRCKAEMGGPSSRDLNILHQALTSCKVEMGGPSSRDLSVLHQALTS